MDEFKQKQKCGVFHGETNKHDGIHRQERPDNFAEVA